MFFCFTQSFARIFLFLILFMSVQAGRGLTSKTAHVKDPDLRRLAADLPLRTIGANVPSTMER